MIFSKETLEALSRTSEPISEQSSHYVELRHHLLRMKYHISVLKNVGSGSPTLAIKEMMYECGREALK